MNVHNIILYIDIKGRSPFNHRLCEIYSRYYCIHSQISFHRKLKNIEQHSI